jgi:uncharacterized membrane protein YciS (DUF1049 family)
MSVKVFLKLIVFLATLFVVICIGVSNQQSAVIHFMDQKRTTDAWIIYFGMFAIGVFAGAVLMAGGGGGGRSRSSKSEK